jgi:FkbM family methyltransferase
MTLRKLAAVTLNKLFTHHTYTVRHGLAKGLKRRGGLAFLPGFIASTPKRFEEERVLTSLELDGLTVYDVGGDQGTYTLFFARRVGERGRVVTFEPNPTSYRRIVANVELNDFRNVDVRRIGLGAAKGNVSLVFPAGEPARGSADPKIQAQLRREKIARTIEIDVDTLDAQVAECRLPRPDLVKIDVEGLELDVLRGMNGLLRTHRPDLFIELHGADAQSKGENARQVVTLLLDAGYSVFHVESKQNVTRADIETARQGHLYCKSRRD